jgi:PIN domain nuclease of toxin-antitoxin system
MRLLLDTHIFLWYVTADPMLPAKYKAAIEDPFSDPFLSVVSVWEAVIKNGLGKLPLPGPPAIYMPEQRRLHEIEALDIDELSMPFLADLPLLHRDPFDRLLIAQARQHGMTIATVDPEVIAYPVSVLPTA